MIKYQPINYRLGYENLRYKLLIKATTMSNTNVTKICTKCSIIKDISSFGKSGRYIRSECKICTNVDAQSRRLLNPEKVKASKAKHKKQQSKLMTDTYIIKLVTRDFSINKNVAITQELIEIKRNQLTLSRWIKENK